MKQRRRIYYTETQKALMWQRWRKGDTLAQIARLFDRYHSSIQGVLASSISRPSQSARLVSRITHCLFKRARSIVSPASFHFIQPSCEHSRAT